MNTNRPDQTGFTLIELLVSIGVLGVITGVLITTFLALTSAYDRADVVTKVNHEGNRIMELLTRMIRNASSVSSSISTTIDLTIPEEVSNIEYSSNGGCTEVEIALSSSTIVKTTTSCSGTALCPGPSGCILNTSEVEVTELNFTVTSSGNNPDLVEIEFGLVQDQTLSDPEQRGEMEFNRVVTTRGY